MVLDALGEIFAEQVSFDECRDKAILRFDFFLPDLRVLIEYDGIQHRKPVEFFGGEVAYIDTMRRDGIKDDFVDATDMTLVRIGCIDSVVPGVVNELIRSWTHDTDCYANCV